MTAYPAMSELVPHAPPMLAVEELTSWEPGVVRARMQVRDDNPLVRDGALDAVVTLEYMAQTVAACLGYEAYREGEGVRVGMVIACRKMRVLQPRLAVGQELRIAAKRVRGADYVSHFDAEVHAGEELVADATLTIVHGEQPP